MFKELIFIFLLSLLLLVIAFTLIGVICEKKGIGSAEEISELHSITLLIAVVGIVLGVLTLTF